MNEVNFTSFPILTTESLVLRKLETSDDKLIFDYQSNQNNFTYVDMPIYSKIEEAQNYIIKMNNGVNNNQWIIWAIADKRSNNILGTISIWNINKDESKAELGYGLFPGNIGKGIMSEALKAVVEFGVSIMGLDVIEAYTNVLNNRSITLLERNGFTKKSLFIEEETTSGKPMEMVIYKLNNKHYE